MEGHSWRGSVVNIVCFISCLPLLAWRGSMCLYPTTPLPNLQFFSFLCGILHACHPQPFCHIFFSSCWAVACPFLGVTCLCLCLYMSCGIQAWASPPLLPTCTVASERTGWAKYGTHGSSWKNFPTCCCLAHAFTALPLPHTPLSPCLPPPSSSCLWSTTALAFCTITLPPGHSLLHLTPLLPVACHWDIYAPYTRRFCTILFLPFNFILYLFSMCCLKTVEQDSGLCFPFGILDRKQDRQLGRLFRCDVATYITCSCILVP